MRKGQINLEFLFAAIIYLGAIGAVLISGTNILPSLSTDVKRSNLYAEAHTVSTKMLAKPGHSSYGETSNWDKNSSTVDSVTSIGLSTSAENYLVVEPEKLDKLQDFTSAKDKINYSEFKDITEAENQYQMNFTWMPVSALNGSFKRYESNSIKVSTSDNLVANWKLDEEDPDSSSDADAIVEDSSGSDNDGTAYGNFGFDQPGIRGTSAYSFDPEEYVRINQGYSYENSTISLWVKPDALTGNQKIIRLGGNGKNWSLKLNDESLNIEYETASSTEDIYSAELTRTWTHVAATIDSDGNYTLYVNGITKGKGTARKNLSEIDPSEVMIGAGDTNTSEVNEEGFGGKLDDVRIYKSSLNDSKIEEIYEGDDPYTKSASNKIIEPSDSNYQSSGNTIRFGRERIGSTYPHFLSVSHNGVFDSIYVSNTWNFTGRSPVFERDSFIFQGESFQLKAIQNTGEVKGNAVVLEQHLKTFGPEPSPDKSVITLERFGVYKNEPMKTEVLSW